MDNLKEWHGYVLVNSDLMNIEDLLDCELCEDVVIFGLFRSNTLFGEMDRSK